VKRWKDTLADVCKGYKPHNIFNMDVTVCFTWTLLSLHSSKQGKNAPEKNDQKSAFQCFHD
jgi:hypothetical protein